MSVVVYPELLVHALSPNEDPIESFCNLIESPLGMLSFWILLSRILIFEKKSYEAV